MKKISRRKFIETTGKGAAFVSSSGILSSCSIFSDKNVKSKMPHRILGKTGLEVSILSFGGGSQFLKNNSGKWEKELMFAIESGINLFDTAPSYVASAVKDPTMNYDGKALDSGEERYGSLLSKYRNDIILATKLESRDPKKVKEEIKGSLSRLKTDYIDILLMHAINNKDTVSEIEKGIYKEMVALKNAGIVKYIGFSSMDSAERSRDLLENLDIDVALLAMNPTKYGDFAKVALPAAIKQNTGVIAMKVLRGIVGKDVTAQELFDYVWTQEGVDTALVGHYGMETLVENINIAREHGNRKMASLQRNELELRMAKFSGPHALCWARPGYIDGGIIINL